MRFPVRLSVLAWLGVAAPAWAQLVSPYEWVVQHGRNNVIDSNASSCDAVEGCYAERGQRCALSPGQICNLQVVPAGRCTSGELAGPSSCVWPHGAGRCSQNSRVGCLTDVYLKTPTNTASGPSFLCAAYSPNTCLMTTDPFGDPFNDKCACQGTNPAGTNYEVAVCGGTRPVCSDGDPHRLDGGFGLAAAGHTVFLSPSYALLGPSVNGSSQPSTSPRYSIENPPTAFDPQRDPGSAGDTNTGPILQERTTNARTWFSFAPALQVDFQRSFGDSFWSDWTVETISTSGAFDTMYAVLPCEPLVGWSTEQPIDAGAPGDPSDDVYCSEAARDGLTFVWNRNLTSGELAANPNCPPNCKKDFDLTTPEYEAILGVAAADSNAGIQLALQSAEGRQAGAGDAVGVTPLSLGVWSSDGDMRCKLGGWGGPPGFIGRCSDGPSLCKPGDPVNGDALCSAEGGICLACGGPIDAANTNLTNGQPNYLGLPPGYSSHGFAPLELVAGKRIGGVAGRGVDAVLRLFLIGTTGSATAEFRDRPNEDSATYDSAQLGPVASTPTPFGVGIGSGGTFLNGSPLPIGGTCCASGANISWSAAAPGTPTGPLLRTFDSGPGGDGIPACIGDNSRVSNGLSACDQRLGSGPPGAKTDPAFNTGLDDVAITQILGGPAVPVSKARFGLRHAGLCSQIPVLFPVYNQVSALTVRDTNFFALRSLDTMVKLDVSHCPIVNGSAVCIDTDCVNDPDSDGIDGAADSCPTIANLDQADGDGDGVGDVCDNCVSVSNPRVAATFLANNPWATLTGSQRDDDHDGYGNPCDAKFVGSGLVGGADLTQFRASFNQSRSLDACGTAGNRPCAIFDLSETDALIGGPDLTRFRLLNNKLPGPKCPVCPLPCASGTSGSCF